MPPNLVRLNHGDISCSSGKPSRGGTSICDLSGQYCTFAAFSLPKMDKKKKKQPK